MDSDALADQALHTQHTFFQAEIAGRCINLLARPWNASGERWQHPTDYGACQQLAAAARNHEVAWIRYASARRARGICGVALMPASLSLKPGFAQQTWACKSTRTNVFLQHDDTTHSFDAFAELIDACRQRRSPASDARVSAGILGVPDSSCGRSRA